MSSVLQTIINNSFIVTALTLLFGLLLDSWWGEPRRFHPLVGFGNWANWLELGLKALQAHRLKYYLAYKGATNAI